MVDISKVEYKVLIITPDGDHADITPIATNLGWEEGEKELAVRISMQIVNAKYNGKDVSEIICPGTPVFIYYIINDGEPEEAVRGTVEKWKLNFSNSRTTIDIEAYDMMNAARHNQDNKYFSEGTSTKAIMENILSNWQMPYSYNGPSVSHGKTVFKHKYLSDMFKTVLDEARKKGAGVYYIRAKKGVVEVIPRGSNEDIYHFDQDENAVSVTDSFDISNTVTCAIVVGKSKNEGHEPVQAVLYGKTSTFGHRQVIYDMPKESSLDETTKSAQEMLKEKGEAARKTDLHAPDLPFLRKGDRIRVRAGTAQGYFFVKSVRHNAADGSMTLAIDEDKERNESIDTNYSSEATEEGDGS